MKAVIDYDKCDDNGENPCVCNCLDACSVYGALSAIPKMRNGLIGVEPSICTGCGDCVDACPVGAITMEGN